MAEKHPTKLVAYTPRLDKALKRLTKWSDSIDLKTKNPSGKRQSIETSIPVETETEAGYNGQFKVVWNGTGIVKIIDGADPDETLNRAGQTDIGDVPILTASDIPEICTIYLFVKWDEETKTYSFLLANESNFEQPYGYVILANVYGDTISQVWTGGAIYFGERYFV